MSDEQRSPSPMPFTPPQAEAPPTAGFGPLDSSGEAEPRRSRGGAQPDESKVPSQLADVDGSAGSVASPEGPPVGERPATPPLSGPRPGVAPRSRRSLKPPAPPAPAITPEQRLLILDSWQRPLTIKAVSSSLHMPVQVLNDRGLTYPCRCSVAWRLSLALYTKAGGVPWKMAGFEDRHAYVGLGYCLRKSPERRFVTCCSQIFDAQGTNLQFLLFESRAGGFEGDNPFLPRSDMHRVMSRTLALYQDQKGRPPTRVVVHKTTHFTREEVDGCLDALATVDDVELLTLTQTTPWKGVKIDPPKVRGATKGEASMYPLERGIAMPLGIYDFLLWTQGNCSAIGGNFFKEGKGIPHPVRITRHVGGGTFHESAREILGLSKMNWNNDSLYDRLPVTTTYASILAGIVKRMGPLSSLPYDFRYFM